MATDNKSSDNKNDDDDDDDEQKGGCTPSNTTHEAAQGYQLHPRVCTTGNIENKDVKVRGCV